VNAAALRPPLEPPLPLLGAVSLRGYASLFHKHAWGGGRFDGKQATNDWIPILYWVLREYPFDLDTLLPRGSRDRKDD